MNSEAECSMKDKDRSKTNNLVNFPNLHERLVMKGLAELGNKDFTRAAQLFTQAREYDDENAEVNLGLLVSLVELHYYEEARPLCQALLDQGMGDYFQLMSIYLMVLLQLHEYEEMVATIELLFKENQIPFDKIEHFETMLSFSKKATVEKQLEGERREDQFQKQFQEEGLFTNKNDQQLLDVMTKLAQMNVRPFMDEIKLFLRNEENNPFFKTMLMMMLKEQEYAESIELTKFSKTISIIPAQLVDLQANALFKQIFDWTERELSQRDPILLEMTHSLLARHHFLLYPFEPEQDPKAMAAAYHALAEEYMTGQDVSKVVTKIYQIDRRKVIDCIAELRKIETISYPII